MGLDITVLGKPLPGHEVEFDALLRSISRDSGVLKDDRPRPGLLQRLLGKGHKRMTEAARQIQTDRFNAIALPPYAALGAPIVGADPAADAWAVDAALKAGKSPDAAEQTLADLAGFHVLALLPPSDGFALPFQRSHGLRR